MKFYQKPSAIFLVLSTEDAITNSGVIELPIDPIGNGDSPLEEPV